MAYTLKQVPSPNYTRGRSQKISKVIVHWIVGNLSAADAVFKNPKAQTSAHYGIENKTVHQYVAEANTAWHAISANPFSIGIEHSAAPGRPASNATYDTSIELIAEICRRYKLNPDTAIEPHSKYVATQCPGTMDLNRIKKGVKARLNVAKLSTAQITKAYQDLLGRKPDAGGLKHYLASGFTEAQLRADLKGSAEYKKRQARIKAEADAKAKADAAKKAAEAAEKARLEAEAKKKAEEEAKKAQTDKWGEENNSLLKQILALLKSVFNR